MAVVQIDYQPAALINGYCPREDPLQWTTERSSLDPKPGTLPNIFDERLAALRQEIRQQHDEHLCRKIVAILETCRRWDIHLVVFPEYSIPHEILPEIATVHPSGVVVAGTHVVDRRGLDSDVYRTLQCPSEQIPGLYESVCPVLHDGRIIAIQSKIHPSRLEHDQIVPGTRWHSIPLPDQLGIPGDLGILICLDFLTQAHRVDGAGRHAEEYNVLREQTLLRLNGCAVLAVPSLTPSHSLAEFVGEARRAALREKRPVLYANHSHFGGSFIHVDAANSLIVEPLPASEEGILVLDWDFSRRSQGRSTGFDFHPNVVQVARASFVYRVDPVEDEYANFLGILDSALAASPLGSQESTIAVQDLIQQNRQILVNLVLANQSIERGARVRKLLSHADSLTLDGLRFHLREVVLPEDICPLHSARQVFTLQTLSHLQAWLTDDPSPELARMIQNLRSAVSPKGHHGSIVSSTTNTMVRAAPQYNSDVPTRNFTRPHGVETSTVKDEPGAPEVDYTIDENVRCVNLLSLRLGQPALDIVADLGEGTARENGRGGSTTARELTIFWGGDGFHLRAHPALCSEYGFRLPARVGDVPYGCLPVSYTYFPDGNNVPDSRCVITLMSDCIKVQTRIGRFTLRPARGIFA